MISTAIENLFFLLAPSWLQWPLTILATVATVIASQALISGAFSVRSSTNLAAAYGVAVTLTMVITTLLIGWVARSSWGWSTPRLVLILLPLLIIDVGFASANLFKIPAGGWVPLAVGLAGFTIFTTWRSGRSLVAARLDRRSLTIPDFVAGLASDPPSRHDGTGVYLHRIPGAVPPALLANLRSNRSLHEIVVFVSMITEDRPSVLPVERDRLTDHGNGFFELSMHDGFAESPRSGDDLAVLFLDTVSFDPDHTTHFLGRERIEAGERPGMALWRDRLFAFMSRNASDPSVHFALRKGRSVDIGVHVEI